MPPSPHSDETQPRILRTFTTLHHLKPKWGGSLILSLGLDTQGAALSVAANIAGAVSLAIDPDPTNLREVVRTGAADFVVNTLDEAIRAMKNEVRKHAPLSIALTADPILVLNEILERGLAPQLFATFLPPTPHIAQVAATLQSLGATLVDFTGNTASPGFQSSQSILAPFLNQHGWHLQTLTFETPAVLRAFDAEALAFLPPEDTLRRRWLEAAPRILQRQRPPQRSLWLTQHETEILSSRRNEKPVKSSSDSTPTPEKR
jgi:urocanate hydratase